MPKKPREDCYITRKLRDPKIKAEFDRLLAEWLEEYRPRMESLKSMERPTARDFAVVVNV